METPLAVPQVSRMRGLVRATLFVLVTIIMFCPVFLLWALTLEKLRGKVVSIYYTLAGWVSGVRIEVEGELSRERPLMLVANHSSYLDIFVLGSIVPLSFTPKLEIRSWPIIGFFCVLADCVFIERKSSDMQRAQAEMAARLSNGKVLVLFPEGTTGDGFHVMPFKSGFLKLAEEYHLPIQPVSVAYTHIGNTPLSASTREDVSWIGDASFADHFWRLLRFPSVRVKVKLYAVEHMTRHEDRKALAKSCENTIRDGLAVTLEASGVTS